MRWKQPAVLLRTMHIIYIHTCSLSSPRPPTHRHTSPTHPSSCSCTKCEFIMDASKHLSFSYGFLSHLLVSAEFLVIVVIWVELRWHRFLYGGCVEIFLVNIISIWLNGSSFACSMHDLLDKKLCKHPPLGICHTTVQRLHLQRAIDVCGVYRVCDYNAFT